MLFSKGLVFSKGLTRGGGNKERIKKNSEPSDLVFELWLCGGKAFKISKIMGEDELL